MRIILLKGYLLTCRGTQYKFDSVLTNKCLMY